jgi:formylglycine-generating enzyme required for sulfatase activity
VHLIQKTMLPKSTPVNVAEVFLSGMIERKKNDSSEINEYDFVVGVRKLLNQAMRLAETERVLDVVSEYIAEKMGLSMKSFTALLLNMPYLSQEQQVNLLPFAHVRAEVLRNLGGKYAELAEQIEPNKLLISDDVPPVQELIFEVATITIELELEIQPFEFEVAIIELERKAPVIKRSRQQAQYFIEDLGNGVRLEMVSIPEGSFMMGAPRNEKDRNNSERPQHQVTVQPFFMGKYTVTQEQWKAVAALPRINRDLEADPSRFKGANRPVERVSWYDAVEFCDRVTRLVNEHRFSQHTGKSYRLPSEAEWEYTCRAGTTTPFHFGETITSELANYDANYTYGARVKRTYREETTVVGSFGVANNFGLYDMHGNVCEWCLDDWHSNYEGAPTDGSAWFDGNDNDNLHQKQGNAMLRGGSWSSVPISCRSASRDFNLRASRDFHDLNFGFRVVCAFGRIF